MSALHSHWQCCKLEVPATAVVGKNKVALPRLEQAWLPGGGHTCVHAYIHACMHTYMHACIQLYVYISVCACPYLVPVSPRLALPHLTLLHLALPRPLAPPCPALPCLGPPRPALPCLALPCPSLPRLALPETSSAGLDWTRLGFILADSTCLFSRTAAIPFCAM